MITREKWRRHRFTQPTEDYRPIKFPPPGPYWCSGYNSDDEAILIAYLPRDVALIDWWPEAKDDEYTDEACVTFSDRFPKPDWW